MANIREYLNNIKNAIFGKDVRSSIHDGINAINNEVISNTTLTNNTKVRQDLLENKYDEQIRNIAASEPQSPEIVDARSGFNTLGNIISKKTYYFNTVAEMKACTKLKNGDCVQTLGYYSANDGGGATYQIVNDTSLVDDGGSVHDINNGLKAKLIVKDSVNVKQFGAKGDGTTNDTDGVVNAIKTQKKIIFTDGNYLINDITLNNIDIDILGVNAFIKNGQLICNNCNVKLENINFSDILTKSLYFNSCEVKIKKCSFNNVTIQEQANLTSHSAIYLSNNIKAIIENCDFSNIKSYGAIYTYGYGYINVNNSYFNNCDYRAFNIIENTNYNIPLRGFIKNNYIVNCGANNTTGSAVGCNGIYAKGCNLIIDNNFIKDSRENAIEIESDYYNMISNNLIDGTNVEIDTKSTPSVEGIFIHSNADIINNRLTNVRRRAISSPKSNDNNNFYLNIDNNTIVNMIEYDGRTDAIYIIGQSTSNKKITNNITNYNIVCTNANENTKFSGNIKLLRDTATKFNSVIPENSLTNFKCYFNELNNYNGFTLSSISNPSIATINNTNIKGLYFPYQQYNRIQSPKFVPKGKFMVYVKIKFMGTLQVRLMKNGSYLSTLISEKTSQSFTEVESKYVLYESDNISYYQLYINVPNENQELTISDICIEIIN